MSDWCKQREQEGREMAQAFIKLANGNHTLEIEAFATALANDHPTLQQGAMRIFMVFCEKMAAKHHVDARNQGSVDLAQQIVKLNHWLPYI